MVLYTLSLFENDVCFSAFLIGGILLNRYSFVFTDIILDVRWSRNTLFCAISCVLLGSMVRLKDILHY